jgi:hypothetical protein
LLTSNNSLDGCSVVAGVVALACHQAGDTTGTLAAVLVLLTATKNTNKSWMLRPRKLCIRSDLWIRRRIPNHSARQVDLTTRKYARKRNFRGVPRLASSETRREMGSGLLVGIILHYEERIFRGWHLCFCFACAFESLL